MASTLRQRHDIFYLAAFRQDGGSCTTKNPDRNVQSGFFKSYPANAVQADYPFPFSNGWMTVAAASDVQ